IFVFFFQAEDGIRDFHVTGVQTCALPIFSGSFTVGDTAKLVARYHYVEAQLMRIAAGKLAVLPEWEVKCLLGRHLWQDSLHANRSEERRVGKECRSRWQPGGDSRNSYGEL